jgi:hypothetical protein
MRKIFAMRMFWRVATMEMADGYLHDITGERYIIFTSYGKGHGHKKRSTTFREAKYRFISKG